MEAADAKLTADAKLFIVFCAGWNSVVEESEYSRCTLSKHEVTSEYMIKLHFLLVLSTT